VTPVGNIVITSPPPVALNATETYQFVAEVVGQATRVLQGNQWILTAPTLTGRTITWATSNGSVATIDANGLLTAVGSGSCNVTAKCEGVTSTAVVATVSAGAPVVSTVTVAPATFNVVVGATAQLTATPKDSGGSVIPGLSVGWGTSNGAVATVDASGLVTGVGAGTCTITATISAVPGTSACTAQAAPVGTLRTYTSREWEFLLGPQVQPGTYSATGITLFESSLTSRVNEFVTRMTTIPGFSSTGATGTIAVTNGSSAVVGTGTSFTGKVGRGIKIPDGTAPGGYRYAIIVTVTDDTHCTIGGYHYGNGAYVNTNYLGVTDSGLTYQLSNTATQEGFPPDQFNSQWNYYDTIHAIYQAWAKVDNQAGGSDLLVAARAMVEGLADTRSIGGWQINCQAGADFSPRTAALLGHMCGAVDRHPEWWTNLAKFVDAQNPTWLGRELPAGSRGGLPHLLSVRDAAYMQMFTAALAALHPNAGSRTTYQTAAVNYAVNALIRKRTETNGGYLWKVVTSTQDSTWVTEADGTTIAAAAQPFLNSLLIESLIWTHRMLRFNGVTSGADYDTIGNAIVEGCRGWYSTYRQASNGFGATLRAVSYWAGLEGQKVKGTTALTVATPPGAPFAINDSGSTWSIIMDERQQNADGFGNLGYAYALSGDTAFLDMYHEVLASCFEFMGSNPTKLSSEWYGIGDGSAFPGTQKNWNQNHARGSHKGLGWIVGGLETF